MGAVVKRRSALRDRRPRQPVAGLRAQAAVSTTGRDRAFELEFLGGALKRANSTGDFVGRVVARLEHAEASYGVDSFRQLGVEQLVTELQEEALDLAGWGVLLAQVLVDVDTGMPVGRRDRALQQLRQVVAVAVVVDELLQRVGREVASVA